jgi:CrcB protein
MNDLLLFFGVAAAGAVGAPARYVIDGWVQGRLGGEFPLGTLIVNLAGSLLLGLVTGLVLYHAFPNTPRVVLGTGFCGAYTTFSTFTFETARLAEENERVRALVNIGGTAVGCTLAAGLGLIVASAF